MEQKEKPSKEKEQAYAEIMHMFRYFYTGKWSSENIFNGKSRVWIQAFNELVKQGFIKRKKTLFGYKYKWAGVWPENY